MALADKTLLLVCDDEKISAATVEAIRPLVRNLVVASKTTDALNRAQRQVFDGVLHRTKVPSLADPKGFFQWTRAQKGHQDTPWVVLGKDVESQAVLPPSANVKFLEKPSDGAGLIRILEDMFFTPPKEKDDPPALDVNFINPLMGAVVEVVKSMARIELQRGRPFAKGKPHVPALKADVSGLIEMNSDRFLGSVAICFTEPLMLRVCENMLGAKSKTGDKAVRDAVTQLTQGIFGHAQRDLNAAGHTLAPAVPNVVSGRGHAIPHSVEGLGICVPFESSAGTLFVECVMSPRSARRAS